MSSGFRHSGKCYLSCLLVGLIKQKLLQCKQQYARPSVSGDE